MNKHMLIGCIEKLDNIIKTRFFYLNAEENKISDVTEELCEAINDYNKVAREIRLKEEYAMIIPYEYKGGLAEYSFGCGLSHYLQEDVLPVVSERSKQALSFPLSECRIQMLTKNDVKHILGVKSVWDNDNIKKSIVSRYGLAQ